ncbi:MAG: hypothetical protein WCY41_03415 [Candidatus Micrarchaeia archaeon]
MASFKDPCSYNPKKKPDARRNDTQKLHSKTFKRAEANPREFVDEMEDGPFRGASKARKEIEITSVIAGREGRKDGLKLILKCSNSKCPMRNQFTGRCMDEPSMYVPDEWAKGIKKAAKKENAAKNAGKTD